METLFSHPEPPREHTAHSRGLFAIAAIIVILIGLWWLLDERARERAASARQPLHVGINLEELTCELNVSEFAAGSHPIVVEAQDDVIVVARIRDESGRVVFRDSAAPAPGQDAQAEELQGRPAADTTAVSLGRGRYTVECLARDVLIGQRPLRVT